MGGRDILIEKIKQLIRSLFQEGDKSNKKRIVMIIGIVGLLLIIVSNMLTPEKKREEHVQLAVEEKENDTLHVTEDASLIVNVAEIEKRYEKDLQTMLNNIDGVTDVEVMVNLHSSNVKVYEKNTSIGKQVTEEIDKNGGERSIEDETEESEIVFVRQGDREVPLLIQTNKPDVKGVLIIAKGAHQVEVKKWIVDAVSKVLDVPTHRISVMPKVEGDN